MSINFFTENCREQSRSEERFGICDDTDSLPAYTTVDNPQSWLATVINPELQAVTFTAIDNCVIAFKPGTNERESRCEGMLTFRDRLFLVELKSIRGGGWLPRAIGQLENTIRLLATHHDLTLYKKKIAFACNNRHTHFEYFQSDEKQAFMHENFGFRLHAGAEILIR